MKNKKVVLVAATALVLLLVRLATEGPGWNLLIAWVIILFLTWWDGSDTGLLAALFLFVIVLIDPGLVADWQKAALFGVFLGCIDKMPRWVQYIILSVSLLLLGPALESWIAAGSALVSFVMALLLRNRLRSLKSFIVDAALGLKPDGLAIFAYIILFFLFAAGLSLGHRVIDLRGSEPQLRFDNWNGAELAPVGYYLYFTVVTSLSGPPSDVTITGPIARSLATVEVFAGVLFLALILKELLALTPKLVHGSHK